MLAQGDNFSSSASKWAYRAVQACQAGARLLR